MKYQGVCSRNYLPKIKDGTCLTNIDCYASIETQWVTVFVKNRAAIYFDNFDILLLLIFIERFKSL